MVATLCVEESSDSSESETALIASFIQRQTEDEKKDLEEFFISRTNNLILNVLLLLGCYSAILIPAYHPPDRLTDTDGHQESKDLVFLNRSFSLLSGPCHPRWTVDHLKALSCSTGLTDVPVFVEGLGGSSSWDQLPPPLGLRGSEQQLARVLSALPQPGLPLSLQGGREGREGSCRRCVVVGSGGVLHGSHLGPHIDQYDVVIRLNNAPVAGFERDAGSKTTIRLVYPEGAPHSTGEYTNTSVVALVVFKSLDLDWLASVVTKQPLSFWSKLWFWREVVEDIPLRPENFRILHPEVVHRTGQALQSYAHNQGKLVPTLGASAVVMALQVCDQVSLAGFGYDLQHPEARLHYYETIRMEAMKVQVVHDVSAEKLFLKDLVAAGAVNDLTGAL